jgi:nicotinate-nucleotide pyrophosphorylase (carboxylating)
MSGIATLTRRYVERVASTGAVILDTRKTAPGLRWFDKYAVRAGGGANHRFGLFDGILIKDNHIAAAGSITRAVGLAKERAPHTLKVEVEVEDLGGLQEALAAGADIILLDNMPPDQLRSAVAMTAGRAMLEASGGITLETVLAVAETGVDAVSVGALTHSARAVDVSLEIVPL